MINVTITYGLERNASISVEEGTTIAQALDKVQSALGFGSNVKALIEGVTQPETNTVRDGDTIAIETAANSKAALSGEVSVTVTYGLEHSITTSVQEGSTIQHVLDKVRGALGFGSNVKALIHGASQPLCGNIAEGDVINVETAANSKAV
jgi:hypothetical protein